MLTLLDPVGVGTRVDRLGSGTAINRGLYLGSQLLQGLTNYSFALVDRLLMSSDPS
jgi:hypothetical protein